MNYLKAHLFSQSLWGNAGMLGKSKASFCGVEAQAWRFPMGPAWEESRDGVMLGHTVN
jgi:hypothetical protein